MTEHEPIQDVIEYPEFDDLVKELDAMLDAWFLSAVAPSLEEAERARSCATAQPHAA